MGTKKPYRIITKKEIRRARAKLILWLTWELTKYDLMRRLIKKFKQEGIFENHRDFIRAWLTHLDQKRFSEKVEKQMLEEIKRYLATRDKKILDYIVEVV